MSRPDGYLVPSTVFPCGVTVDDVVREMARGFGVTAAEIIGPERGHRVVMTARACAMALVRQSTGWSYPAIGRVFGRDHTTVMHHVRKVLDDPELGEAIRQVAEELSPPPRLFAVSDLPNEAAI